jgi:hypothetical protein
LVSLEYANLHHATIKRAASAIIFTIVPHYICLIRMIAEMSDILGGS